MCRQIGSAGRSEATELILVVNPRISDPRRLMMARAALRWGRSHGNG